MNVAAARFSWQSLPFTGVRVFQAHIILCMRLKCGPTIYTDESGGLGCVSSANPYATVRGRGFVQMSSRLYRSPIACTCFPGGVRTLCVHFALFTVRRNSWNLRGEEGIHHHVTGIPQRPVRRSNLNSCPKWSRHFFKANIAMAISFSKGRSTRYLLDGSIRMYIWWDVGGVYVSMCVSVCEQKRVWVCENHGDCIWQATFFRAHSGLPLIVISIFSSRAKPFPCECPIQKRHTRALCISHIHTVLRSLLYIAICRGS